MDSPVSPKDEIWVSAFVRHISAGLCSVFIPFWP